MSICIEIDNRLSIHLMCYLFIILIFRILAEEKIGKNIDDWSQASILVKLEQILIVPSLLNVWAINVIMEV